MSPLARIALAVWALAALAAGAAGPPAAEWPSYLGPNGNFSESSGAKLLDDMTRARLAWVSEETKIGFGKAHTGAGKSGVGKDFLGLPPGGEASPIVAGGLVIQSYFAPRGEAWDATIEKRMGAAFEKHVWLVAADDVVIAMDAATGRTKWKQVFEDKGINTGAGKRGGWAVTPCAADGKVFSLGTTGRIYALDLASGKPLWESNIGERHTQLEAAKAKALAEQHLVNVSRPYGMLVVVDGVLLVPDWNWGLLGVEAATGKTLWRLDKGSREMILSGYNAPCPVRVGDKSYVACASMKGDLRLIEPKTGRILWTVSLKCEHLTQPVATAEHLLVFEPNPTYSGEPGSRESDVTRYGVLAAYRFDESGATRDWALPGEHIHELHLDGGPGRRVIPRDGLVYYLCWGKKGDERHRRLLIIREKDGAILKAHDVAASHFYLWGDRLVTVSDLQHRPRAANAEIWQLYTTDPADFRALGSGWHVNNPQNRIHMATGGYEVPVFEAFADGLMFCRVMGGIRCYDLRAAPK
ncbi:MAG TPA: PQQ-binding-like beta-propeller repeat protein [Planctomycetota bacterium]|nr:PQQ-binding-like beta-propeller repeat protein [Planctomycetota bacterium]